IPRSLSSCANLKCSDTLAGLAANSPPGINQGSYRCTFLPNAASAGEIGRISKPSVLLKEGHCRTLGSPHSKQGLQRYISPIHESRLGGECRHEDCQCRIPHPRESGQSPYRRTYWMDCCTLGADRTVLSMRPHPLVPALHRALLP